VLENALGLPFRRKSFGLLSPVPFSLTLPAAAVAAGWCALQRLQEVVGRPARDHGFAGSGARVELQAEMGVSDNCIVCRGLIAVTYKVYFRCSSISMIAAWLPQR
jgi:hypothetical protein